MSVTSHKLLRSPCRLTAWTFASTVPWQRSTVCITFDPASGGEERKVVNTMVVGVFQIRKLRRLSARSSGVSTYPLYRDGISDRQWNDSAVLLPCRRQAGQGRATSKANGLFAVRQLTVAKRHLGHQPPRRSKAGATALPPIAAAPRLGWGARSRPTRDLCCRDRRSQSRILTSPAP